MSALFDSVLQQYTWIEAELDILRSVLQDVPPREQQVSDSLLEIVVIAHR